MCGIVGYIGEQPVAPLLLEGLKRLEYRGYDSAGVAVVKNGTIQIRKEAGKIAELERLLDEEPVEGVYGIGHTRWATHGPPTERNAHPHISENGDFAVVHNGIIENATTLRRRLEELGFVGVNLNPDPSGGFWTSPPLTDPYWFPVFEALVELDVPAMVHVSSSCNPNFHALGAHYLNADTSVFMQLLEGDLFERFPTLRLVIPHGGGAVPYHWGRYRGLAMRMGRPDPATLLRNVFFDTCVYHQPGIDLLTRVIPAENILFASEMLGAVRGADPETGVAWDDTKRYLDAAGLTAEQQQAVFSDNARRVYPRLDARLTKSGR